MKSREPARLNRLGDITIRNRVRDGELRRTKNGKLSPLYHDGGGLYLKITGPGTASWVFRYKLNKRERELGLGAYPQITLAEARDKAQDMRKLLAQNIDPLEHRDTTKRQAALAEAKAVTFEECANKWLEGRKKVNTARVTIRDEQLIYNHTKLLLPLLIRDIDTTLVLKVLEPIWEKIPPTAEKLRGFLEQIFDAAKVRGYRNRDSENPARWKGHLQHCLSSIYSFHVIENHPSLPYAEVPKFIVALNDWRNHARATRAVRGSPGGPKHDGTRALAVHFQVLTTTRPSEAAGAEWSEIDWQTRVWNIPAERMKPRRPHSIPLSDQAISILQLQQQRSLVPPMLFTPLGKRIQAAIEAHPDWRYSKIAAFCDCTWTSVPLCVEDIKSRLELSKYIFETRSRQAIKERRDTHVDGATLKDYIIEPMGYGHIDPHGFRSSFSTWVNDETDYPPELREFQLSHQVDDKTARAYNHGIGLEKRRRMLQHWADYCDGIIEGKVVPLHRGRTA